MFSSSLAHELCCTLRHFSLPGCCFKTSDGTFCSPYLHSLILQLPFLAKDWIRPVQRDFALPLSPDKPFAGAGEHFPGQSTSSQPMTESISHYPEPLHGGFGNNFILATAQQLMIMEMSPKNQDWEQFHKADPGTWSVPMDMEETRQKK